MSSLRWRAGAARKSRLRGEFMHVNVFGLLLLQTDKEVAHPAVAAGSLPPGARALTCHSLCLENRASEPLAHQEPAAQRSRARLRRSGCARLERFCFLRFSIESGSRKVRITKR
jgi:hypothetical protein